MLLLVVDKTFLELEAEAALCIVEGPLPGVELQVVDEVLLSAVAPLTLMPLEGALTCVQGAVPLEPEAHLLLLHVGIPAGLAPLKARWCQTSCHHFCAQRIPCSPSRCSSEDGRASKSNCSQLGFLPSVPRGGPLGLGIYSGSTQL